MIVIAISKPQNTISSLIHGGLKANNHVLLKLLEVSFDIAMIMIAYMRFYITMKSLVILSVFFFYFGTSCCHP